MQYKQLNYRALAWGALLVVALLFVTRTAFSQGITDRSKPDPILAAAADGPCDPALDQPDLTPGTDVDGHQVAAADIQTGTAPVPGQVMIPLKANGGYVLADGKKLDALLNPRSSCK